MANIPFRITLRFEQRLADLSFSPQCSLIQEPHFWAALEFDPVQIQFLQVVALKSFETGSLLRMSRYRLEDGRLVRVVIDDDEPDDNTTILAGIPVQSFASQGIMFDVIAEDVRERLVHRVSDEQRGNVLRLWNNVAPGGEDRVAMEVARARIRQCQMELMLESVRANPSQFQPIQQLIEVLNSHELQIWESLDTRRTGFLTYLDLLLGAVQSETLFGNMNEDEDVCEEVVSDHDDRLNVATQTSDVSDSSGDDDAAPKEALERIHRHVTPVTIHKKPLFWRQRISSRLLLLHSSPDSSRHSLWLKKPTATWLKCEMIPVTDVISVVSGPSKFPASSDQQSRRLQRRGFSIEIRTPEAPEWIHFSVKRQKIRDAWVEALTAFLPQRLGSESSLP